MFSVRSSGEPNMRDIRNQNARRPTRDALRQSLAIVLVASMGMIATAGAQPRGNPKGTVTPPETSAPKARASSEADRPRGTGTDQGKLVGNEARTRARVQSTQPPGGGTAGGLQRRELNDASGGTAARTDKGSAGSRPVPPSR
jgi:hypothetical protein